MTEQLHHPSDVQPVDSDHRILDELLLLREQQRISSLDWHFGQFIQQVNDAPCSALQLAAVLLSNELARGNVCIDLERIAGYSGLPLTHWPDAQQWRQCLAQQSTVAEVTDNGYSTTTAGAIQCPLVLEGNRLYMNRYWQYEAELAADLLSRSQARDITDPVQLRESLTRYFGADATQMVDWQKVAAAISVTRRFSVVSGGPGTGKTTTVTKLLAIYIEQFTRVHAGKFPRIRLAAPTGKAAARLSESIKQAKAGLGAEAEILAAIPEDAGTLHRLLGGGMNGRRFRHHQDNPLLLDLLVLDEASMVDLPMMTHLLNALSAESHLILLGDRDQLASVEAGSVLGDICAQGVPQYSEQLSRQLAMLCDDPRLESMLGAKDDDDRGQDDNDRVRIESPLSDSICLLRHSYRFAENSGIGRLATAVNSGNRIAAGQLFAMALPDLTRHLVDQRSYQQLLKLAVEGYREYLSLIDIKDYKPVSVLRGFARFQVLCALREGDFGAEGLNNRIEVALSQQQLIDDTNHWYSGRPVMITRNDYAMKLFNGDIGIVMPDPDRSGELRVGFEMADGRVRFVTPGRLPEHVTVYAMTVHKSQGSEFDHPLLVLPAEHSPLISRELLYTGITRAREKLDIFISDELLTRALATRTQRVSGLADRLWSGV